MIDVRSIRDVIASFWFVLNGRIPWKAGYVAYRNRYVSSVLRSKKFDESILQSEYGSGLDERAVEYPWFFSRLPEGSGRLLDAGSVLNHKFIILQEVLRVKKVFVSTLSPEPHCYWRYGISYVFEDLRDACFKDGYFDWVVSLSTLEHIGLDNTFLYTDDASKKENLPNSYLNAIKEYRRVLKKGGTLYLSIPFGVHKNHGWFQVFDSAMVDRVVETFSPSSAREFIFRYEGRGWSMSSREACKDAICFDINAEKRYKKGYPSFSEAIACLELTN